MITSIVTDLAYAKGLLGAGSHAALQFLMHVNDEAGSVTGAAVRWP